MDKMIAKVILYNSVPKLAIYKSKDNNKKQQ